MDTQDIGTLRPMRDSDLEMVLEWRNAPEVRSYMYTQQLISLEEHRQWWAKTKTDPSCHYLVFESGGTPMGVVNFTKISPTHKNAFWGFYAEPSAPKGTGARLGFCALEYAFQRLALSRLTGEVLADNAASLAFHKKLGFCKTGRLAAHKEIDGTQADVYRFAIDAAAWAQSRAAVLEQIKNGYRNGK